VSAVLGAARLAGFAGITTAFGARLLARPPDAARQARITNLWGRALCRYIGMDVHVEGALPREPALLVSNHRSYADIPALAACLPVTFVAKAEVLDWPVMGAAAARAGTLFVKRGDARSGAKVLRAMRTLAGAGVSVVIFPEGTTIGPPGIGEFHRGSFQLAAAAKIPVVPVALEYTRIDDAWTDEGDASFVPHFVRTFGRRRVGVRIAFGEARTLRDANALHDEVVRWIGARVAGGTKGDGGALSV
jgi:1-acyl-sn-glycerol-3-phosphate acyltransferase